MIPVQALYEGYAALGLEEPGRLFIGSLPAKAPLPCTTLAPYGGDPHPDLPVFWLQVQVSCYAATQQEAHEKAQASYDALHQKKLWQLTGWLVGLILARQVPFPLSEQDGQGKLLYRVTWNFQAWMRAA